jgi:predicted nucleotidyltransferase component of viral defense system
MKDIIQAKLESYRSKTSEDEENALKEITQEIVLYAFSKAGFFKFSTFQGGTCLRIVHGIERFSEDLDFTLQKKDLSFDIQGYVSSAARILDEYVFRSLPNGIEYRVWFQFIWPR